MRPEVTPGADLVARYAELFRAEAREHVAELSTGLVELERTGSPEWIDVLFRAAHTLKGMCATMGFSVSERLAHALEELLATMRTQQHAIPAQMALLFRALDVLEPLLLSSTGARDSGAPSIEPLVNELIRAAQELAAPEGAALPTEGATIAADPDVALTAARSAFRPAAVVRVPRRTLDALIDLVGEVVVARDRLVRQLDVEGTPALRTVSHGLSRLVDQVRDELLDVRIAPIGEVLERMHRIARDASRTVGRDVVLELAGSDLPVDRAVLDPLGELLVHLVRNAIDHGIEDAAERVARGKAADGTVRLTATRRGTVVDVTVEDDGRGIDRVRVRALAVARGLIGPEVGRLDDDQLLAILAAPGFTTRDGASRVSGRGVGIDAVSSRARGMGGTVRLETTPGRGTRVTLSLPATMAVQRVLVIASDALRVAIPVGSVEEVIDLEASEQTGASSDAVEGRQGAVPIVPLSVALGGAAAPSTAGAASYAVVVYDGTGSRIGLAVHAVLGQHEVVQKRWAAPRTRSGLQRFTSGTILGDGLPTLIVDVSSLLARTP
jgi:two-component system, chemotaxis family, sensor kinase CheA